MSVNLKISLGTVAYTDFIHVTASKVSSPTAIVWETWIDVPVTNYNFVIPDLDPDNYFVRYYDSPDDTSLGMLRMELIVNALTGEYVYERRFYKCGGAGATDPADGSFSIIDPYFSGKIIVGLFKEAFRYLMPNVEYSYTDSTTTISKLDGIAFNANEVIAVDIQYKIADSGSSSGGGLYSGTLTVTEATKTLLVADKNKLIRCLGTTATQVITLPTLASLTVDDGFYFDNTVGGAAIQVKILTQGGDRINFNGFNGAENNFAEFWVSAGEHLLIKKFDDTVFEVRSDYKGADVGTRACLRLATQAGWVPEDGRLLDGNIYGRLWYYITMLLPTTHYVTDNTADSYSYVFNPARIGQFVIKGGGSKLFRMPNTQGLSERGLASFATYGGDSANRTYDYPGGFQNEMVGPHLHGGVPRKINDTDRGVGGSSLFSLDDNGNTDNGTGTEQRLKNFGGIYCTKI